MLYVLCSMLHELAPTLKQLFRLFDRQFDDESGTFAFPVRFGPYTPAVVFDHSLADIKTEARSAGVQSPDVFAAGKLGFFLAPLKELLSPWVNKSSILRLDKFVF